MIIRYKQVECRTDNMIGFFSFSSTDGNVIHTLTRSRSNSTLDGANVISTLTILNLCHVNVAWNSRISRTFLLATCFGCNNLFIVDNFIKWYESEELLFWKNFLLVNWIYYCWTEIFSGGAMSLIFNLYLYIPVPI